MGSTRAAGRGWRRARQRLRGAGGWCTAPHCPHPSATRCGPRTTAAPAPVGTEGTHWRPPPPAAQPAAGPPAGLRLLGAAMGSPRGYGDGGSSRSPPAATVAPSLSMGAPGRPPSRRCVPLRRCPRAARCTAPSRPHRRCPLPVHTTSPSSPRPPTRPHLTASAVPPPHSTVPTAVPALRGWDGGAVRGEASAQLPDGGGLGGAVPGGAQSRGYMAHGDALSGTGGWGGGGIGV